MLGALVVFFCGEDMLGPFEVRRGLPIVVADEPCEDEAVDGSVGSHGIGEGVQEKVFVRGFFGTSRAACGGRASDLGLTV